MVSVDCMCECAYIISILALFMHAFFYNIMSHAYSKLFKSSSIKII